MGHPQPAIYTSKSGKKYSYDARKILAIDDVDTKCDAIVDAAKNGCDKICKDMNNVQIGKEALSVADKSLEPALEQIGDYIKSISTDGVRPSTDKIKEQAANVFAKLQTEEDARAKADCDAENKRYEAEQAKKNKG